MSRWSSLPKELQPVRPKPPRTPRAWALTALPRIWIHQKGFFDASDLQFVDTVAPLEDWAARWNNIPNPDRVEFNTLVFSGQQDWQKRVITTQELGHALGLDHNNDIADQVMRSAGYPASWVVTPQAHDIADHDVLWSVGGQAHVAALSWLDWRGEGYTLGTTGQGLRLEALKFEALRGGDGISSNPSATLSCLAHVSGLGWLPNYVGENQVCGTTGQNRAVEAVVLTLDPVPNSSMSVQYRCHVSTIGWMAWVNEGQTCGTTGQGLQMEAIQVKLTNLTN